MNTYKNLYIVSFLIVLFLVGGIVNGTFNNDFFGNVSEWAMVMVTIVTAYYLYETLNSQRKVQSDQEKLNKLNTYQIRKTLKPNIEISDLRFTSGQDYGFTLFITNNPIHNIKISSKNNFVIDSHYADTIDDDQFTYRISRIVPQREPITLKIIEVNLEQFQQIDNTINLFDITFEDEFNFQYSKSILIEYNTNTYTLTHRSSNDNFL